MVGDRDRAGSATSRSSSIGAVPGYGPIFNAGAVFHDGRFHLFARGVRDRYRRNSGSGARFLDYVSDMLVFTSRRRPHLRVPAGARRRRPGRDLLLRGPAGAPASAPARTSTSSCPTRTCRRRRRNEFWRIGVHRLDVRGRRLLARRELGTRDRAPGRARQGRDRLQPPRRPRGADPPDLPQHAARASSTRSSELV